MLCDAYPDAMLDGVEPGPRGWRGILLQHHCELDWPERAWRVPNLSELIATLQSASPEVVRRQPFGQEAIRTLPKLIDFLIEAGKKGLCVSVSKR